jgi:hypothetical protein
MKDDKIEIRKPWTFEDNNEPLGANLGSLPSRSFA